MLPSMLPPVYASFTRLEEYLSLDEVLVAKVLR